MRDLRRKPDLRAFRAQGDVLKLNEGLSRVRCPACRSLGPVRASFREACDGWNARAGAPAPSAPPAASWPFGYPSTGDAQERTPPV